MTVSMPACFSTSSSFSAMARVTSFSSTPDGPTAPGSGPPCPASMATMRPARVSATGALIQGSHLASAPYPSRSSAVNKTSKTWRRWTVTKKTLSRNTSHLLNLLPAPNGAGATPRPLLGKRIPPAAALFRPHRLQDPVPAPFGQFRHVAENFLHFSRQALGALAGAGHHHQPPAGQQAAAGLLHPGVHHPLARPDGGIGRDERKPPAARGGEAVAGHRFGVVDAVAPQVGPGQLHGPL